MKILLFITGYRQVDEYYYFNIFLEKLKLNSICDIYIYCNNPNIQNNIINFYQNFNQENKRLLITSLNSGYRVGGVEAVSQGIEMGIFNEYDYVIHLHPDVFITDDLYLTQVLSNNISNDIVFFITKSIPDDPNFFSFDFFIFKPKLLTKNIFLDELYTFTDCPEHYFHDMIIKHNINYTFIKRFDNDNWYPRRIDDNLRLYHEHDMNNVVNLLQNRGQFKPPAARKVMSQRSDSDYEPFGKICNGVNSGVTGEDNNHCEFSTHNSIKDKCFMKIGVLTQTICKENKSLCNNDYFNEVVYIESSKYEKMISVINKEHREKNHAFELKLYNFEINDNNHIDTSCNPKFIQRFIKKNIYESYICDWIIRESEKYAFENGGWTTTRHDLYPTTDLPLKKITSIFPFISESLFTIIQFIKKSYCLDDKHIFNVHDVFIIKYDANLQSNLEIHTDNSEISVNILLSDPNEFEGGGTYFDDGIVTFLEKGDALIHCGKTKHSGLEITKGRRYILVAFIHIHNPYC
jgi:hypothetical protein